MQFSLVALIAGLSAFASAQYTNRSHAFNLVLESSTNKTTNGLQLTACHTGAAIESLCTYQVDSDNEGAEFYYNYTTQAGSETVGIITWNLPYNGNQIESEPMTFSYDPASNVAMPLFFPGYDSIQVTFDKNNYLYVVSDIDDTVSPPTYKQTNLSRWQLCQTNYGGYTYTTLAWVLGTAKPQNPSCQAVKVKRSAIKH